MSPVAPSMYSEIANCALASKRQASVWLEPVLVAWNQNSTVGAGPVYVPPKAHVPGEGYLIGVVRYVPCVVDGGLNVTARRPSKPGPETFEAPMPVPAGTPPRPTAWRCRAL